MKKALWAVMAVLSVVFAVVSWRYIFFTGFFETEGWQHHLHNYPVATYAHFGLAPLALLLGSFQFLDRLRSRSPRLHRTMGQIYVLSCILAGVGGLPLALNSEAGPVAALGFGLLAVFWLYTTISAFWSARSGHFLAHKVWMIRSFSLTFAGVTLRLYLGVFSGLLGYDFAVVYPVAAWACWVLNLLAADMVIVRRLVLAEAQKHA